ncbi:pentatricopeptide repeat-containing protein At1g06140, mitochondrial-like [Oryza brachyantha]|uniref:Pentacotripeptide-repeat region of PRORP domain-containing protein n=1 Tax=Oryza brachyantha TaxID=4533 RepID=J3KZS7_ORYBR|nr:pentatricopeptide repeat-containing protein At1g06140, mitochondrial-like [Oryza brachyantha]XP_040381195.1 pentatricopeptide repeat-containing protein At1g06140, mitochondrial-like [Oryza brachyantha]XP_040381200.1 pentatricopeptide repeat-containing protein At1g06140, mitochondrial-like [Oryza brachyantha]XP_040381204.1 pentatricopeptide repeat-containing protein At1g06140, mitochondrial-like [Oryza brachyantha]
MMTISIILRNLAGNTSSKFDKIAMLKLRRRLSGSTADKNSCSSKICSFDKFASLIQGCADVRFLKKIHGRVFTHGLCRDVIVGSKILSWYANLGALPESRLVFQKIASDDLSLWNSTMVDYFRAGYPEEVIILYKRLKLHQIGFDGKTITFVLKSCTELKNLSLGKGVHVDSLKLCLSGDKFVGSSLIGLYSKLGRVDDLQGVFKEIINKDIIAYTSMITGYSDIVDSIAWNAFEIAIDMLQNNLEVNRVTLVSLLKIAANLGALKEGKSLHCYSIRRAIGVSDDILETSIVNLYTRCGAYQSATAVLRNSKGTVASWNAMLSGLARAGQSFNAIQYLSAMMHDHKVTPDSVTFANVLSACAELCYFRIAASIHAYFIRRFMPVDVVLATALIEVYSKCTRIMRSRHLFDQLIIKDAVCYNAMMYGYLQNEMANEATYLLKCMMAEGITPDFATVLSLLAAFADQRDLVRGRWIHGYAIRHGFGSDVDVKNQILYMYSVCGKVTAARAMFDSLEKKNLVSWTTMMKGCLSNGHVDEVVQLFQVMQKHGEKPDCISLITAVQASADRGHLNSLKQIHCFVYRSLLEKDKITANSLISAYAKCGRLDLSINLFCSLDYRNLDTWNAMISAYAMHGFYINVLNMFKQMEEENIHPDELTFSTVLTVCSHAGLVEDAWRIFNSMTSVYSVLPQEEHYGCMVDLLGRAGQLEDGYKILKISNLKDKSSILCALLSACRTHGNTELAHAIIKELLEHGPQNPGIYALISEVYAQEGQWNAFANTRARANLSGLKKHPGSSLIESMEQGMW